MTRHKIIHVALVDDHRLFREGLAGLLSSRAALRVVAQGERAADVLDTAEAAAIDVLLLDVELDGPPARTTIATIRRDRPDIAIVVLTMHRDEVLRRSLLAAGAVDFVTKTAPSSELIERIVQAAEGGISPASSTAASGPIDKDGPLLSDREREVLRLVSAARTNAEIALELGLAVGTVKRHVYNVFRKLDVGSRVAAIAAAKRLGLLE